MFYCSNSNAIIFKCFEIFKFCFNSTVGGWHNKNGHKNEASWSDFESKVLSIKQKLEKGRPNKGIANQFSIPGRTLATWKKSREKIFEAFQNSSLKLQSENWNIRKVKWSLAGNRISINGPIPLKKAHEFAKVFNYNDFRASNYGCSNGWSSLACTILYIVKAHSLLIFSKFGRNNLNSCNSKAHVIRTSFESPWGFELYEFNCI